MTIKELKEKISALPDDMPVLRDDNSGGYEKIYDTKVGPCVTIGSDKPKFHALILS